MLRTTCVSNKLAPWRVPCTGSAFNNVVVATCDINNNKLGTCGPPSGAPRKLVFPERKMWFGKKDLWGCSVWRNLVSHICIFFVTLEIVA